MDIKVLYVNSDGYDQEHSESADSIKMLSFKTANKELTDAKLSDLVDGADANDQHIHDARYFRKNQFITSSTGIADANKPVETGAAGKIDQSFIDVPGLNASLDHGTLTGLGDDDHPQYLKADGSRNLSGIQSYASHPSFTAGSTQVPDVKYVDDKIAGVVNGIEWQDSVLSRSITPPATPATGDRYLVDLTLGTPTGAWLGQGDKVAQWNGSAWVFTSPTVGMAVAVDNETTVLYYYTGSAWDAKQFESTTASTGLTKVGNDIRLASSAAGDGLAFLAGVLSTKVDDASVGLNGSKQIYVKALGIKDGMIDFGTGVGQVNAQDLPIIDSAGNTAQTTVEGAIGELYGMVGAVGVDYSVGLGGVTKGYPVVVSGNNTVTEYGALSNAQRIVGVAYSTETNGGTVKVLANDTVVPGVLSGATAGQPIYWGGSGFVTAMPTGAGSHVWELGVAKNATDLHVDVRSVKRNA